MLQEHIENSILLLASRHRVKSREDVVQIFNDMGLKVERTTDKSISISYKAFENNFRFECDISEQQLYDLGEPQRKSKAIKVWRDDMKIKSDYNKALYDQSKSISLIVDVKSLPLETELAELQ